MKVKVKDVLCRIFSLVELLLIIGSLIVLISSPKINFVLSNVLFYSFIIVTIILNVINDALNRSEWCDDLNIIGSIGIYLVCIIMSLIYVALVYKTSFDILWAIFIIYMLFYFCYIGYTYINSTRTSENNISYRWKCLTFLFVLTLDLFYISIFKFESGWTIAFGVLLLIMIIRDIVVNFLCNKMSKISLVFDAIIALILSVYIVYIIEDTKLQNITLVLVSSFIGALVILLGTMKTISYTKCENRKEEIKSLKPYLLLGSEDKKIKVSDSIFNSSILTNEIVSGKGLIESIVRDANIKVSNQNDCIVIGLIINDKYYPYDKKTFLERGSSIRFNVLNGQLLDFVDEIDNISIVCEDVLGNAYKYMLNLGRDINEDDVTTLTIVGIDTPCPYKIICSNRYHL